MTLYKEVIGFYPNWLSSNLYTSFRYDAVTTIAYFSLLVQPNGSFSKQSYPPTNLINYAHSKNVKVVVVINADWGSPTIDTILASSSLQTTVINNLLYEVQQNGFDGADVDFEGFPATNRVNGQSNKTLFNRFITSLSNKLWSANPNYRLSIDLPPIDWENVFDTPTLQRYVNYLMIMGYDYHWQTGPTAGAVAPLNSENNISVVNSVNTYLQTIPRSKLLLGVPYYGYEWSTVSNAREASTVGGGVSYKYSEIVANKINIYPSQWDSIWQSPYYTYKTGSQWYQGWYDNVQSLSLKYDLVNNTSLAGIGIWALGYDLPRQELGDLVVNKFSTPIPPIPDKYDCINNVCQASPNGMYTDPNCQGACSLPPPPPPPLICNPGYTDVIGVCVPQNYVLYAGILASMYVLIKIR